MNKFQQWIRSREFHDLAAQLTVSNDPGDFGECLERLKEAVIAAEQVFSREAEGASVAAAMPPGLSRYTAAILQFQQATGGAAVYCFVVDGKLGTGGMPLVAGFPPPEEYRRRCEALIALLRRSADMLAEDIGSGGVVG